MIKQRAVLDWIHNDQGGRTKPPLGVAVPSYAAVVRFDDEPWPPVNGAWSLIVIKDPDLSTEFRWVAEVHYVSEKAPHDSLKCGRAFELYEGSKCVARGKIVGKEKCENILQQEASP